MRADDPNLPYLRRIAGLDCRAGTCRSRYGPPTSFKPMNLHQEHHFESEIRARLAVNGRLYSEGTGLSDRA